MGWKIFWKNKRVGTLIKDPRVSEHCNVLRDLVPFVQFKKREKHPWRTVTFSKVASLNILEYNKTYISIRERKVIQKSSCCTIH